MMVAMAPFNLDERECQVSSLQAFQMLDVCKGRRLQRLERESYLGPMQFEDDLCHLCAEFYLELKKQ
jgi:hypothetical protein